MAVGPSRISHPHLHHHQVANLSFSRPPSSSAGFRLEKTDNSNNNSNNSNNDNNYDCNYTCNCNYNNYNNYYDYTSYDYLSRHDRRRVESRATAYPPPAYQPG